MLIDLTPEEAGVISGLIEAWKKGLTPDRSGDTTTFVDNQCESISTKIEKALNKEEKVEELHEISLLEKEWLILDHLVFIVEDAIGHEDSHISKLREGLTRIRRMMCDSPKEAYTLRLSAQELKTLANLTYQVSEVAKHDDVLNELYRKLDNIYNQITGRYL